MFYAFLPSPLPFEIRVLPGFTITFKSNPNTISKIKDLLF